MGLFDKGNDGGGDPHQDIQQGINQMQGMYNNTMGFMNPFINAGQNALGPYQKAITPMLTPDQFYQKMMHGYTESPQAKLRQQEGEQAYDRSAAASGMLGSGALGKAVSNFTQQNIGADQQNWLNNMLGIYEQGLKGNSDLAHIGLQGGLGMGQIGQGYASQMGNMYDHMSQQDWAQNQQGNQNFFSLLGLGGGLAGTIMGGPLGGMTGGMMGSNQLPYPRF